MTNDKLITRKAAMAMLNISEATIKRMEARGELVGVQGLGKDKMYLESDIQEIIQGLFRKLEKAKKAAARLKEI